MDQFKRRYTSEQRAAVVDAILLDNMTAPAAVAAAAKGKLGLSAFAMPVTTARHLAGQERKRRRAADPGEWMRGEVTWAKEQLEHAGRRLRQEKNPDPTRVARHVKAVVQVGNALRELERRSTRPLAPNGATGATTGEPEVLDLVARLAAQSADGPEQEEPTLT